MNRHIDPEAIFNTAVYFKNVYEDSWITEPFAKEMILEIGKTQDITINLRHLMDFGRGTFDIHILNTNQDVHSMKELVRLYV